MSYSCSVDLTGPITHLRRIPDWGWLLLLAALLRLPTIAVENLWYDEGFTAWIAKLPLSQAWAAIRGDVHPPLWYLIEWALAHIFGDSALVLRLPAALFGILSVWLLWRIALAVNFTRSTAFLAGLLGALLPGVLYYSQEARMYAMLLFFTLMMINAALRGGRIVVALAGIGAVYSQNIGVLYVAALIAMETIFWLRTPFRHEAEPVLAAGIVIAAFWAPWALTTVSSQLAQVGQAFWLTPITPGTVLFPLISLGPGLRIADGWQAPIYIVFFGLYLIGLIASRRWLFLSFNTPVLAGLVGAPLLAIGISLVWRDIFLHRAMIASVTLLCLPMAYGLTHLAPANRRAAWLVFGPALLISLISFYVPAGRGRGDIQNWLKQIAYQPGDVVYHVALDTAILTAYYAPYPMAIFPEASDLSQSLTAATKVAMGFHQVPFDDLASQGYRRAWLVSSVGPLISQAELSETERIKATYPTQVISELGDDYNKSWIYLVELKR